MTSRVSRLRAVLVAALAATSPVTSIFGPAPAAAAIQTDPAQLYATMHQAYQRGGDQGWTFASNSYYLSTVLDAGRAYSLFNPTDAQYAEVAGLAVDVCSQLHYDPLTNDDAAEWYVREAATYESQHGTPPRVAEANAILTKLNASDDDTAKLAADAEADALANAVSFPHDADADVQIVVADVRAYNLTHDPLYRSDMLLHGSEASTPLVRVPDPELPQLFAVVRDAIASAPLAGSTAAAAAAAAVAVAPSSGAGAIAVSGTAAPFTDADRANARAIEYRRQHTAELQIISRTIAIPHDIRLTRTAPADEYFGRLKVSPLGVRNELVRINKYLDYGWGTRMTSDALNLEDTIVDWQHQYPRDTTLPQHLFDCYELLERVDSEKTLAAATVLKNLLLVQYAGTAQAQLLASS